MEKKSEINWFEIIAADAERAAGFYNDVFGLEIRVQACGTEKMGMFPDCIGAISEVKGYEPGIGGVIIYFDAGSDMQGILSRIEAAGGSVLLPKTRIEVDGAGYFALFSDTEGNRLGLHSKN